MIVKILNKTTNQHQRSLQKVIAIGHSCKTKEYIYAEYKSQCKIDSDDPDLFKKLVAERLNAYDKLDIIIDLLIEFRSLSSCYFFDLPRSLWSDVKDVAEQYKLCEKAIFHSNQLSLGGIPKSVWESDQITCEQKWALCEKGMGYDYYAFITIPKEVWGSSNIENTDKYSSCEKCVIDDNISLLAFADYVWSEFTEDQKYKLCFLAISKNINDLLFIPSSIWDMDEKKVQKLINHAFRDGGYLDLSKIEDTGEAYHDKCSSNFVKHRDIFLDLFKRTLKNNGMKLKDLVKYDLIDAFDIALEDEGFDRISTREKYEFCKIAVEQTGAAIAHVPDSVWNSDQVTDAEKYELYETAVAQTGDALKHVPAEFCKSKTVTDAEKYELWKTAVEQTGDALKHVPAEVWKSKTVTDEQKYELYKIAVTQTGDALKHVPAEVWKSKTVTDEQKYELCKIAVEQTGLALKSVPVEILFRENSFELSDNGQALLSDVFLKEVDTNCHPKFAYCFNRDAYLSLMKSLSQRSSFPFYILGDSDMLCSESRAILESGGTDRPVYLFLKMDSKYNALLESFKFEFEMGQFITLHKTVQVIILAEDRDRFSNDVFSRCHEEYADPMLSWFKLNPAKLDVAPSTKALDCKDIAVDSIPDSVRSMFNALPTIIDPLRLAETSFTSRNGSYLRRLQVNDGVVVQTVEEYNYMLEKYSNTGLDLTFSRVSPLMSNVGKEKMSDFEDLTKKSFLPLCTAIADLDSHLEFCLIQKNIELDDNEQIKAYFNNQELCLPIDKDVDLYQAVFKDSDSQRWMIFYRENVYTLKDLSFYDLRGMAIKSFHAPSIFTDRTAIDHLKKLYKQVPDFCSNTNPAMDMFKYVVDFLYSDEPILFLEGRPGTGKDYNTQAILKMMQSMETMDGPKLDFSLITAGSDCPLVQQLELAIQNSVKEGRKACLVLVVSEPNLCSSNAMVEVLFLAKTQGLSVKVIGTQNSIETSLSRFLTDPIFKDYTKAVPDFSKKCLELLAKSYWSSYISNSDYTFHAGCLVDLHFKVLCSCEKMKLAPTLRSLELVVRDIASHYDNSDNDIIRKRLTHYDKYQTSLDKHYCFEFFVSVSKYSNTGSSVKTSRPIESHSMKFTPGYRPDNDWQSIGPLYYKRDAASLVRVHEDHRPIVDFSNVFDIDSHGVSRSCEAGEEIELFFILDQGMQIHFEVVKKGVLVNCNMYKDQWDSISSGRFRNPFDENVTVRCLSANPISLFSEYCMNPSEVITFLLDECKEAPSDQEHKLLEAFLEITSGKKCLLTPENILNAMGIRARLDCPYEIVTGLFKFFNSFVDDYPVRKPRVDGLDDRHLHLLYSLLNQVGVCRHQAQLMSIILKVLGISFKTYTNHSHAFNVIRLGVMNNGQIETKDFYLDFNYFKTSDKKSLGRYQLAKNLFEANPTSFTDITGEFFLKYLINPHHIIYKSEEMTAVINTLSNAFKLEAAFKLIEGLHSTYKDVKKRASQSLDIVSNPPAIRQTDRGSKKDKREENIKRKKCSFDAISNSLKTKSTFSWTVDDLFNAISEDFSDHDLEAWLELLNKAGPQDSRLLAEAIGCVVCDFFPKGSIKKIKYLRKDELGNCDQRVSKIETYSGPLYVLKTSVPSLRSNVTAIYLSYEFAVSNEDEETETAFILTAKGIKSMTEYRELKEDVSNRDSAKRARIHSELSIEEKTLVLKNETLVLINETLENNGFPKITVQEPVQWPKELSSGWMNANSLVTVSVSTNDSYMSYVNRLFTKIGIDDMFS